MKRVFILLLVIVFSAFLIQGCSGGSSASPDVQDSVASSAGDDGGDVGDIPSPVIGELGDLIDLGDLVYPQGDHWYFTWARAIDDEGTVIGQSNRGSPVRAAFKWEPGSEEMTFLGIQAGVYEDFYGQKVSDPILKPTPFIYSQAVDIIATDTIIGYSSTGAGWPDESQKRAFLWENDVFIDLPPIPGWFEDPSDPTSTCQINSFSKAVDINHNGEVILTLDDDLPGDRHAYYWDGVTYINKNLCRDDGSVIPISVPDYQILGRVIGASSEAVAINENGQAVINSGSTVIFHDLNWDVIEVLNQLPSSCIAVAVDINDSGFVNNDGIPDGHVIGNSGCFDPAVLDRILHYTFLELTEIYVPEEVQGFFWDGGAMYPVDHLGGGKSVAADINNKDQVVGGALNADDKTHAFLWTLGPDKKGVIRDLGTLGGDNSFALAINEAGQVVGWAETGESYDEQGVVRPVRHAFLWEDGNMYDLGVHNDFYDYPFIPPYPFSYAVDINEQGVLNALTGNSITINQHSRGFFLSLEQP